MDTTDIPWQIEWRSGESERMNRIAGRERARRVFGDRWFLTLDGVNYGSVHRNEHLDELYGRNRGWQGMIFFSPLAELALVTTGSFDDLEEAKAAHLAWVLEQVQPGGRLQAPAERKVDWDRDKKIADERFDQLVKEWRETREQEHRS